MDFMPRTTVHNHHRLGHSLIVIGFLSLLIFSLLLSAVSTRPAVAFGTSTMFELTNLARVNNGQEILRLNEDLTAAAQAKADTMVKDGYFEHTAPDGTTGWDYIEETDYDYSFAGENLAASNESDEAVVNGWLNSPGHRDNLLNEKFKDIGLGMAFADRYQQYRDVYFIVALYAQPTESKTIAQSVTTSGSNGLALLSKDSFAINSNSSYLILSVCALLLLAGIGLEFRKISRHFAKPLAH